MFNKTYYYPNTKTYNVDEVELLENCDTGLACFKFKDGKIKKCPKQSIDVLFFKTFGDAAKKLIRNLEIKISDEVERISECNENITKLVAHFERIEKEIKNSRVAHW